MDRSTDDTSPSHAPLSRDSRIDSVLWDMAREHFDLIRCCEDVARVLTEYRRRPAATSGKDLAAAISRFGRHLRHHIEFEEREGFLTVALERRPGMASQIEQLLKDHNSMPLLLRRAEALVARVGAASAPDEEMCRCLELLLARLREHEDAEKDVAAQGFPESERLFAQ